VRKVKATGNDGEELTDWFAANVRDCTPAGARPPVRVMFAPFDPNGASRRLCASVLSESERRQAAGFATSPLTQRFVHRRAFRRYCAALALGKAVPLSRIEFATTEKGRPYLAAFPELSFSFSACRLGVLGAYSTAHAVGVDIEDPASRVEALQLAQCYFTPGEAYAVAAAGGPDRARAFLTYWTLKEAALKSIGEGLPFGLDRFEFALEPEPRMVMVPSEHGDPGRFQCLQIEGTGGCAALVLHRSGASGDRRIQNGERPHDQRIRAGLEIGPCVQQPDVRRNPHAFVTDHAG
jgi:4'-phosphopantetheinyl transferase